MPDAAIALVPARSGSLRVPGKNVRPLGGHPLIAWTIAGARATGLFDSILVSTDSAETAEIARRYGAEVPWLRSAELAGATAPDIAWVRHAIDWLGEQGRGYELFSILRPTSPFRRPATIRAAFERLRSLGDRADSIRAVRLCQEHPAKMWQLGPEDLMEPLQPGELDGTPLHSQQYQALPEVYVQTSSLELAWMRTLRGPSPSIAGSRIAGLVVDGPDALSIDYPEDFERAERAVGDGLAAFPAEPSEAPA